MIDVHQTLGNWLVELAVSRAPVMLLIHWAHPAMSLLGIVGACQGLEDALAASAKSCTGGILAQNVKLVIVTPEALRLHSAIVLLVYVFVMRELKDPGVTSVHVDTLVHSQTVHHATSVLRFGIPLFKK